MTGDLNGNQWRAIGELQGDMRALKGDVEEIRDSQRTMAADIATIKGGLAVEKAERRGIARGYAAAGAAGGAVATAGAWALSKFPWIAQLIGAAPR